MKNKQDNIKEKPKPKFPKKKIVIHSILIVFMIVITCLVIFYDSKPMDQINKYEVTVTPLEDGRLNIEYKIKWTVLRGKDGLDHVEIGLANRDFEIENSSKNIRRIKTNKSGYGVKIYFEQTYYPDDTFEFNFSVIQGSMLCLHNENYLYEFVPCWFESIEVDEYIFKWKCHEDGLSESLTKTVDGYYVWEGSFEAAEYQRMFVNYQLEAFDDPKTVMYVPFNGNDIVNETEDTKTTLGILVLFINIFAISYMIIDVKFFFINKASAYSKGTGFRSNSKSRHYNHVGSSGGMGGRGGGRSCACACACAGGGRAGCSQKDTYSHVNDKSN